MGRIRTVKPELFIHGDLFDLEKETGLPIRLAYIGLWTQCDREGRFKWKPRELKASILPYDECDFPRVLDALVTRGYVVRYTSGSKEYGHVPSWHDHQQINGRESDSVLPKPNDSNDVVTRAARVDDASSTCHEGKGREGKGREEESASNTRELLTSDMIAKEVMVKSGMSSDKVYFAIRDQVRIEMGHASGIGIMEPLANTLMGQMCDIWERFQKSTPKLQYKWGADKFFGEGYWRDEMRWPWKDGMEPRKKSESTVKIEPRPLDFAIPKNDLDPRSLIGKVN